MFTAFSNRTESYAFYKISLYCFDDKIYILDNAIDALALGY